MDLALEEVEDLFDAELFVDKSYIVKLIAVDDVQLQIYALHSASTTDHDLTGQIVWPAAKLLASYLTSHRELCCEATSVLELGAGAGFAGLVAATLFKDPSSCALTDNNERILEILERNINSNFTDEKRRPKCCPLSWGAEEAHKFAQVHGDFDLILGADVVFWPAAVPLLFETVHVFLSRRPGAKFLLSYINRNDFSTHSMFEHARRLNLSWRTCDISALSVPEHLRNDAQLLVFTLNDSLAEF